MPLIELDQEIVDFLRANEALSGEPPSEFIRKLVGKRSQQTQVVRRARSEHSDLAVFLRILREMNSKYPEKFSAVGSVRGRTRIYFSTDPKEIEASGRSTKPVEIFETDWWVTSNTSTDRKRSILEEVFRAVGCSAEDRRRWLIEFTGSQEASEPCATHEDDDPFKI